MSKQEEKSLLRQRIKQALRECSPEALAAWDRCVAEKLLALAQFRQAGCILSYAPFGREFNADLLNRAILAQGKQLALPLVTGAGQMEARLVGSLEKLLPGAYGIREPEPESPLLPAERIELLILPGLAFDVEGYRMGRGGGYYDRFLAAFRGFCIAPTRELQLLPFVPREKWDQPADLILTETRTLGPFGR
ncbi:MAG: 5-formyltetrahydrofolate cyclo-ligase [Bacillota bacterium]|nr:5-formyltetrahydrofolate cyclo-ligase [Bacillota bacterium]